MLGSPSAMQLQEFLAVYKLRVAATGVSTYISMLMIMMTDYASFASFFHPFNWTLNSRVRPLVQKTPEAFFGHAA